MPLPGASRVGRPAARGRSGAARKNKLVAGRGQPTLDNFFRSLPKPDTESEFESEEEPLPDSVHSSQTAPPSRSSSTTGTPVARFRPRSLLQRKIVESPFSSSSKSELSAISSDESSGQSWSPLRKGKRGTDGRRPSTDGKIDINSFCVYLLAV